MIKCLLIGFALLIGKQLFARHLEDVQKKTEPQQSYGNRRNGQTPVQTESLGSIDPGADT